MKDIVVIGAGGFGREVAWLIERINQVEPVWHMVGFLDDNADLHGKVLNGYKVLGGCEKLAEYPDAYVVCAVGSSKVRAKIIERLEKMPIKVNYATLVDPSVLMSKYVAIGEGTIICAHSVLTVNIDIGRHVLINLDCTIGHDARISDFATLFPGTNMSGATQIGRYVELGTGMQIIPGVSIGEHTIVGAGAVVTKDLPENCTAVGCPAKPIKYHEKN